MSASKHTYFSIRLTFLFVIMMLNIKLVSLTLSMYRYLPIFCIFGSLFFLELMFILGNDLTCIDLMYLFKNEFYLCNDLLLNWKFLIIYNLNLTIFSNVLYTHYVCLFLISGIVLLVSMVGSISLTLHRRNDIKRQIIFKQIYRHFSDSVCWKT